MSTKMWTQFPEDLLLGFSSSSYQIEGGWNENGKGENIWDKFTHEHPERITDKSNGDVACDFVHKYKEDVKLMKDLGCQVYRFSLSWSRILPKGFANQVNQRGIDFYNSLIDELIKNNIEPMITLYHWDLPQPLQDLGGWPNPLLADYFCDFAEVAFKHFGDKVKKWITFNEPEAICLLGHAGSPFAPGVNLPGIADYLAGHTLLKAHAKAYYLYDQRFRAKQKGEIGISVNLNWREPKTNSPKDVEAADESIQFQTGWFVHPIYSEKGDYPEAMKRIIGEESKKQGYPKSRLPEFDQFWIDYIKGTSDFLSLNHYTSALASKTPAKPNEQHHVVASQQDGNITLYASPDWTRVNEWMCVVPWGFRKSLCWIKRECNDPKIYVTENGFLDFGTLDDTDRIKYYQDYLSEMLKAIHEDRCRVKMYTAWSLTDNFEWNKGYTEKFGIFSVDFSDPKRKRTPKKSVRYFKDIIKNRRLPDNLKDYYI